MRRSRVAALGLACLLLPGLAAWPGHTEDVPVQVPQPKKGVTVWAITASKVYHCPASRWYGKGEGKSIDECQAIREGYRPVFGASCGSECR